MVGPEAALVLTLVVHVLGTILLLWALLRGQDDKPDLRGWWWGDDGGDDGREPPTEQPGPRGGGIPLPDAAQSAVRLRGPGLPGRRLPRPPRRPQHVPERDPQRL